MIAFAGVPPGGTVTAAGRAAFAVLLCLLLGGGGARADVPPADDSGAPRPDAVSGSAADRPLTSELLDLVDEADNARRTIERLSRLGEIERRVTTADSDQTRIGEMLDRAELRVVLDLERISAMADRAAKFQALFEKLAGDVAARGEALAGLASSWRERRSSWAAVGGEPAPVTAERPAAELIGRALERVDLVLTDAATAAAAVRRLQGRLAAARDENLGIRERAAELLARGREDLFQPVRPWLLTPAFVRQFRLLSEVEPGAVYRGVDLAFFERFRWLLALQLLLALGLALLGRAARAAVADSKQWSAVLRHPWAIGLFVASAVSIFLYRPPPLLWELLLWVVIAASASVLAGAMFRNRRKVAITYLLAAGYLLLLALEVFFVALPAQRLVLVAVALAGIPYLSLTAAGRRRSIGRRDGFVLCLELGVIVLCLVAVVEAAGFHALANWLLQSSIESAFVVIVVNLLLRLGRGALRLALSNRLARRSRYLRPVRVALEGSLDRLLTIVLVATGALYLIDIWDISGGAERAPARFFALGIGSGDQRVTIGQILLAVASVYLAVILSRLIRAYLEDEAFAGRELETGVRDSIKTLLHYLLLVIGFYVGLALLGFDLRNLTIIAGALGVGVGFGLQNIVNNFVSGLILLFERPVRVGDLVVIGEDWGNISKIGLRSTVVQTFERAELVVPNSQLIAEKVTNWTLSDTQTRITVAVGVAYGSDLERVLRVLVQAAGEVEGVMREPPPMVVFNGFGDSSVDFEVRVWVDEVSKRLPVRTELALAVERRFRLEGIQIPFPQRDLHLRSVEGEAARSLADSGQKGGRSESGAGPDQRS